MELSLTKVWYNIWVFKCHSVTVCMFIQFIVCSTNVSLHNNNLYIYILDLTCSCINIKDNIKYVTAKALKLHVYIRLLTFHGTELDKQIINHLNS